ncbi:MAG: cyclopropane-fatty-acyl-phospholipid synthase family protein [Actinomycetia bacterium]|nr:cyclopropane-fatty-acyl-phospholipid synthase family protein [Actinomycetes bacterium]
MNAVQEKTSPRHSWQIDDERWPDVATAPHSPARAAIAGMLVRRASRLAGVRLTTSADPAIDAVPTIRLADTDEFHSRLGRDGLIGLGEAWMSGAWTSPDLHGVLHTLAEQMTHVVPQPLQGLRRWYDRPMPSDELGDHASARTNVSRHYDLSNDLFATFLDSTMTYSGALFEPGDDLEAAQIRKLDAMLDAAHVGPGTRLLEIGSGWGSLAVRAARRGADVTTITLSEQQISYARAAAQDAGVADRVDVALCDFRDVRGRYDAIVSIEMIEAVGERYWPAYFARLGELLAPSGRVALQAITMGHDHMLATRNSWGWIHKYVFPGGLIPSARAIEEHAGTYGDLAVRQRRSFGPDYAETLRLWRRSFNLSRRAVRTLGFDDVFCRMWDYYLAYCQAGFSSGHLDVDQFVLTHGDTR